MFIWFILFTELENDLREGLQTSIAMSQDQSWFVNGTSSGMITCWDLRFQLPIGTVVEIAYLTNSGKISEFTRIVRFNDQNGSKCHYYFFFS